MSAPRVSIALLFLQAQLIGAEVWTWNDVAREAYRGNPDLAAAQADLESARAFLRVSYGDFLPEISADADYSVSDSNSGSGTQEEIGVGLSVRQDLFTGLRVSAGYEQARAGLQIAEARYDAARAEAAGSARRALAVLLFTQEQRRLTETIVGRRRENVRLVGLRYDGGREHKGSLLRSQANLRQAEFEAAQSARALRLARRELAGALGRQENFEAFAATGSWTVSAPVDADASALALQVPAYREAEARLRVAESALTIARSGFYPSLAASAGISRRGEPWRLDSERWSAGVALNFPLFSGGGTRYSVKGAKAELRLAQALLAVAQRDVGLNLERSLLNYHDAFERTSVQRQFLEAAEVRAQIARGQYTNGLLSFEDWDVIENDLINTQKTWLASLRDAALALADWEEAKGVTP